MINKAGVIIPAYNEEGSISKIVMDVDNALKRNYKNYEIIVVNDCSKDSTLKIAEELKKKNRNIKVCSNPINMGKTRTLLHGIEKSASDFILFIDADYQQDPADIPKLVKKLEDGADICCGRRINRKDSFYRLFISFFFNLFNRVMFSIRIDDINCGLKGFRKRVFENIKIKYPQARWFFDTELLGRAYAKGMKVEQADVRHYPRTEGISKISGIKAAAETIYYGVLLKFEIVFSRWFGG